jgi:NAD(P)-dependent dehydrogenase (short-subunit alcohol dehydrogenase family)
MDSIDFTNKVVIVTGGASGIGQATAREFAERHAAVAIFDRNDQGGAETASALRGAGHTAEYFHVDLAVSAEDETQNANVRSAFLASKYAIPHMVRRGGGAIVIVGSVQSMTAQRNSMAYVVSKHALLGLTRSMALDFAADNIRVNCICPGAIDTPMLRWAASLDEHPERVVDACHKLSMFGRMGRAEEIARVIAFLASDMASYISGSAIVADGGLLTPTGGMLSQESGTGGARK